MEWIVLLIIVGFLAFAISIYNRLVNLRNRVKNSFSQIAVQLTRRHDLIPNLVESVKGYIKHERDTLEAVIKARTAAVGGLSAAAKDPANAQLIQQLASSEGALSNALSKLFVVVEAYPDLKANQNVLQLQEELTATENKVAFSRQAFNDTVLEYNNVCQNFPNNILAGMFKFAIAEYLEIEEGKSAVPKVSLT